MEGRKCFQYFGTVTVTCSLSSGFQQLQEMSLNNSITVGLATPVMACLNVYYMDFLETVLFIAPYDDFPVLKII